MYFIYKLNAMNKHTHTHTSGQIFLSNYTTFLISQNASSKFLFQTGSVNSIK